MQVAGCRVIVTGAANGIGRTLVEVLLKRGACVGALDIDAERLATFPLSDRLVPCRCDITEPEEVVSRIDEVCRRLQGVEVLVNSAGIITNAPLLAIAEGALRPHAVETWDRTLRVNLSGVFYVTRAVAPHMARMRSGGVVVNLGSICAAGNAGQSAYSAAKAGVHALTVTWAKELAPYGIRVVAIAPGFTETEAMARSMGEAVRTQWRRNTPLRRMATPQEIVGGILFAIDNDFLNGRVLELDGGLRL